MFATLLCFPESLKPQGKDLETVAEEVIRLRNGLYDSFPR